MNDEPPSGSASGFSLVRGGPLYRAGRRVGLVRHDDLDALRVSVAAVTLLWLPLVGIAFVERIAHDAWPRLVADLSVHARLLLAMPLYAFAEQWGDLLTMRASERLADVDSVEERESFARITASATRLRDSWLAEAVMLALALGGSHAAQWGVGPWRDSVGTDPTAPLSAARAWYGIVVLPVAQFLTYRWLWRWFVWARFQVRAARLDVRPEAGHPDGAGGLAVVAESAMMLAPVASALSCVLATAWATRILQRGAQLADFHQQLLVFVAVTVCVSFGPCCAFARHLLRSRQRGRVEYARLATQYIRLFRRRWIDRRVGAELLDNPHLENLESLGEIYKRAENTRVVPFSLTMVVRFLPWLLVPMFPLLLTEIPLVELLRRIGEVFLGKLE